MNCRKAETLIQGALDDLLPLSIRAELDLHLDQCSNCRSLWDTHRKLSQIASSWMRPDDPGDAFTDAVMAKIAAQPAHSSFPVFWPRLAYASCLFAALVALSYCAAPFVPDVRLSTTTWLPSLATAAHLPLSLLENVLKGLITPQWLYAALIAACALNGALLRMARRGRRLTT